MHEFILATSLLRKVETIAEEQEATRVTVIKVQLGALAQLSASQLREAFAHVAQGTVADGATLDVDVRTDITEPMAQDILIESIEIEEILPGVSDQLPVGSSR